MTGYKIFHCPYCEVVSRVIWPDPIPKHLCPQSKIGITCPSCNKRSEPYEFLLDIIQSAPNPEMPTTQVESISPGDPNISPNARSEWMHQIFRNRDARFATRSTVQSK